VLGRKTKTLPISHVSATLRMKRRFGVHVLFCVLLAVGGLCSTSIHVRAQGTESHTLGTPPTIVDGNARFIVLSPRLLRLEYSETGRFENRPTFFARHRSTSGEVEVTTRTEDGWRVVDTEEVTFRYRRGSGPFDSTNVVLRFPDDGDTTVVRPSWPTRPDCRPGRACQAEYANHTGQVRVDGRHAWYTGPGFVTDLSGGRVTWHIENSGTDALVLGFRYSASTADTVKMTLGTESAAHLALPATNGWDDWAVVRDTISAETASDVTVRCQACTVHLDYLAIAELGNFLPKGDSGPDGMPLSGWRHGLGFVKDSTGLHPGVVRRRGWTLLDDSRGAVHRADTTWVEPRHRPSTYRDGYLFAYGDNYAAALRDKADLTGAPPMLPRWAFGIWYSRLYPHTSADYRERVVPRAQARELPLSALVLDTDVKAPNRWRGWTWEHELLPRPEKFFGWTEQQDLRVALNVHPSIGADDPRYRKAQRTADSTLVNVQGKCPRWQGDTGPCVVWDWGRPSHMGSYWAVHDPLTQQGIDAWWLDWCCDASRVSMPGLPPDTWINEQYARHRRARGKRGFVLSRIGASWQNPDAARPGAWATHRSAIHFTGDTFPTWDMLNFEAEVTVREGMMGIPYVSHDIGSFHGGGPRADSISDEMYVRWVQFGTFQPVFRLHGHGPRLPWQFGPEADSIASRFMRLRGALVPHLYTLARKAHDTGMPIVRGLPLAFPDYSQAYEWTTQYLLGRQMLVAPVTQPGDRPTTTVWFPPGRWVNWFTGERHQGPMVDTLSVPLDQMPVFLRAGSIVPLQTPSLGDQKREGPLRLRVVAGERAERIVYHDAGTGTEYRNGAHTWERITWTDTSRTLQIGAVRAGRYSGQPSRRAYHLTIQGINRPRRILRYGSDRGSLEDLKSWTYDSGTRTMTVKVPPQPVGESVQIRIQTATDRR
jgi:alpha-glucosidase (family GH31 glycosyl hydrolase)